MTARDLLQEIFDDAMGLGAENSVILGDEEALCLMPVLHHDVLMAEKTAFFSRGDAAGNRVVGYIFDIDRRKPLQRPVCGMGEGE